MSVKFQNLHVHSCLSKKNSMLIWSFPNLIIHITIEDYLTPSSIFFVVFKQLHVTWTSFIEPLFTLCFILSDPVHCLKTNVLQHAYNRLMPCRKYPSIERLSYMTVNYMDLTSTTKVCPTLVVWRIL